MGYFTASCGFGAGPVDRAAPSEPAIAWWSRLNNRASAKRINLIPLAEEAIGHRSLPRNGVIEMVDPRCKIAAIEMEDPRCNSLLHGVVIVMEDHRCQSLTGRVTVEMEDPRCRIVAVKMDDPRCRNLYSMW